MSRRTSPAGLAASGGGGGRVVAYAAALGAAPAALAVFAQGSSNVAWSGYRGGWQLLEIETNTWSWPWGCAVSVAIALGPVLYFAAAIWLGTHGMVLLAEEMTGLVVAAGIAGGLAVLARRAAFPRVAEFDGQVIRQWMVKGDSDSEDEYHVAIDDGTREKAWDLCIGAERYRRLPPGTFVHARVNLRSRVDVTVEPVEPPAVAHPLARVAADQVRAVTNGLPDPADLVLETEAAAILGGKVAQHGAAHASGRSAARGGRAAGAAHRQARTRRSGRLPGQPERRGDGLRADRAHQHPRLGTHRVRGIAGRAAARRGGAAP